MTTAYARHIMQFGAGSVTLTKSGPRAAIQLCNPSKKNALSGRMMAELELAVQTLEQSPEIATVTLRGESGFFCSGADLSIAAGDMSAPSEGQRMCHFMQDVTTRLHNLPAISLAIIEGGALGGGTELSTACDFRFFVGKATWRCVHATIGLSPGWGGGTRLVKLLGRRTAIRLLCGTETVTPEQALTIGLADHLVEPSELDAMVNQFLSKFEELPISAVHACKTVCTSADTLLLQEALIAEQKQLSRLWGGPVNLEAVKKTLSKLHEHRAAAAAASAVVKPDRT